jgi:putative flippase GtrA
MMQIKKINIDKKLLLFLAVGAFNTLVGLSLFPIAYWLLIAYRAHYVVMLVICHGLAVLNSYTTNKLLVFRTKGNCSVEIGKFLLFHMSYLLVTISVVPLLVEFSHFNPVIIQMSMTLLAIVLSFFWYEKVVFSS